MGGGGWRGGSRCPPPPPPLRTGVEGGPGGRKGGGLGCGGSEGARVRQELVLKGKLAAAHLLLAELFLHVPLEHLVQLLVLLLNLFGCQIG